MIYRGNQKLSECDIVDMEEYKQVANIYDDYRFDNPEIWITCDYDFATHLQVGDEIMLYSEDSSNLSPFIHGIEYCDDEENIDISWIVTRKIYSAGGLDVYVNKSNDEFDD